MVKARLRFLINLQNNPNAIAPGGGDPRFRALLGLMSALRAEGHAVFVTCGWGGACGHRCNRTGDGFYEDPRLHIWGELLLSYPLYKKGEAAVDIVVAWAHSHSCKEVGNRARSLRPRTLRFVYEHGLAKNTVTLDPRGLLGNSFYAERLNRVVQRGDAQEDCAMGSKRPQHMGHEDLPARIWRQFILVPTQKALDVSVTQYSKTSMHQLMQQVIGFASNRSLPVVFKVHPHLISDVDGSGEGARQEAMVSHLARVAAHPDVYVSRADIRWLMKAALITVTINGGTLFGNMVTKTPVLAVGRSMLTSNDGVIFDENPQRGLQKIVDEKLPWPTWRQHRQRQIVCWYKKMSLDAEQTPEHNLAVLWRHLDIARAQNCSTRPSLQRKPPYSRRTCGRV